jgi:hypothetical protein
MQYVYIGGTLVPQRPGARDGMSATKAIEAMPSTDQPKPLPDARCLVSSHDALEMSRTMLAEPGADVARSWPMLADPRRVRVPTLAGPRRVRVPTLAEPGCRRWPILAEPGCRCWLVLAGPCRPSRPFTKIMHPTQKQCLFLSSSSLCNMYI